MGHDLSKIALERAASQATPSGTIRWEVDKDSISHSRVYSPSIDVGGMQWRMNVYKTVAGDSLGIFLNLMDGDYILRKVDVAFQIKLIGRINYTAVESSQTFFEPNAFDQGCLISWELIDKKALFKENKLTIKVEFTLLRITGFRAVTRIDLFDPNEPSHDVALMIEGKKIYVSKQHLSIHSPVFHRMFYGEFREKNEKEIELKDTNYKEFLEFLYVIYPPSKSITDDNVNYLLKLGDQFMFGEVIDKAEQYLVKSTKFTVAKKLEYAGRYRLLELQEHCIDSMNTIDDVTNLQATDEFKDFSDAIHTALYRKILNIAASNN